MEKTIKIHRWDNGNVIFLYTCENNTIGKTVEEAIRQGISLAYANLHNTNLDGIDLSNADLSYANLSFADLSFSNLSNAKLIGANLTEVNVIECQISSYDQFINTKGINDQCPKEGSFIGWKKCWIPYYKGNYIVKLEIPADAKRCSSTGKKCRCNKAKVLEIQQISGEVTHINEVYSIYDKNFTYKIGEIVHSDLFDYESLEECSHGIHFFMRRKDAVDYI